MIHSDQDKLKTFCILTLLGGAFVLLPVFLGRTPSDGWLIGVAMATNVLWGIVMLLVHRTISEEDYEALCENDKIKRAFYESMWMQIYSWGFTLFASLALLWAAVKLALQFENMLLYNLSLISYLVIFVGCIVQRRWLDQVRLDGLEKHPRLNMLLKMFLGLAGISPAFAGVARIFQVSIGIEATQQAFLPFGVWLFWILAVSVLIGSTFISLIAASDYREWKSL